MQTIFASIISIRTLSVWRGTCISLTALLLLVSLSHQSVVIGAGSSLSSLPYNNEATFSEQNPASVNRTFAATAQAYYVDGSVSRSGNGSVGSPFKTIQEGVNAADPGDIVWVAAGEYDETVQSVKNGEKGRPISIISNPPVQVPYGAKPGWVPEDESQRVWIRREGVGIEINHSHIVVDGINVDGLWFGNAFVDEDGVYRDPTKDGIWVTGTNGIVRVNHGTAAVTLSNMEMKNNQQTIVRVHGNDVVIDNANIHHGIARVNNTPAPEPGLVTMNDFFRDAHGIVSTGSNNFTVANTYIGYVSGDCIQLGRSEWSYFTFEFSHCEIAPLDEPVLGLKAGTWFGEDHFDTKTPGRGSIGSKFNKGITFRNNIHNGTRYSRITHGAVLNLKEGTKDIVFENNIVYDNRMTLRLRRPTTGYKIRNNVFYNNETVAFFEGRTDVADYHSVQVTDVQILNNTFVNNDVVVREGNGGAEDAIIASNIFVGKNGIELGGPPIVWKHNLFYQAPQELGKRADATSLNADPLFLDHGNGDFRLRPDSPAIPLGMGARPVIIHTGSRLSDVMPANSYDRK